MWSWERAEVAGIEITMLERNALSRRLEDEAALRAPACWPWKPNATRNGEALSGSSPRVMHATSLSGSIR
jgi:hypothetical protein